MLTTKETKTVPYKKICQFVSFGRLLGVMGYRLRVTGYDKS